MTDPDRLSQFLRTKIQGAGRQYEEARKAFEEAKNSARTELPTTDGKARLVCRRHADKRAVRLDTAGRPACFERGHTDCEGCVEDIQEGCIETW